MDKDPKPFTHGQDKQDTHLNTDDGLVVPIHEEELSATTRPVERGEVRIQKDVIEEQRALEVPVTEEEVEITRRQVNRSVTDADLAFEEGTISVPLRGEDVEVEKHSRVVEEVDVDRRAFTTNEQVTDTVRREDVIVDGEGQIERRDDATGRTRP